MIKEKVTIIGAGLTGPLMATLLANNNYTVDIYERRPDMRTKSISAGRSINLALSARGIQALKDVGVFEQVEPNILPMKGRMIHDRHGKTDLQPYGQKNDEVIFSVSRSELNMILMDQAENTGKVKIYFNQPLIGADLDKKELEFEDGNVPFNIVMGSDGSSSQLRGAIVEKNRTKFIKKPLGHGYKELTIPASDLGDYLIDPHALHIWPRGEFMLIALPNKDRSFTCTLFFPMSGECSFETVKDKNSILKLFQKEFPDTLDIIPSLVKDYQTNPTGSLATVYCDQWHFQDRALMFGDAAHAIVPFFGQGMNASFQDCSVINYLIKKYEGNWEKIFFEFSKSQVKNGHAIADMALENYIEMRDSVNNKEYKKRRELELVLEKKFRDKFIPRYSMVSFHQIPYSQVYNRGEIQLNLMNRYLSNELTDTELYRQIEKKLKPIR